MGEDPEGSDSRYRSGKTRLKSSPRRCEGSLGCRQCTASSDPGFHLQCAHGFSPVSIIVGVDARAAQGLIRDARLARVETQEIPRSVIRWLVPLSSPLPGITSRGKMNVMDGWVGRWIDILLGQLSPITPYGRYRARPKRRDRIERIRGVAWDRGTPEVYTTLRLSARVDRRISRPGCGGCCQQEEALTASTTSSTIES